MRLLFPAVPLPIPALEAPPRAPWPVWSGSTATPIRFAPMAKKAAVRLWHRARDFDRGTHQPGRHGGSVGHAGLQVLHSLIFDFLNHRTGQLDPSYAAIARSAGVCVRTVAAAVKRLRELASSIGSASARRAGATGASCWSRKPTPTRSCPRASGAVTGRPQSHQHRRRAPGVDQCLPCPLRSASVAGACSDGCW
jgi:hypothetical protein